MQLRTPSSDQPGQQPGTSHDAFVLEPPSSRLAISSPPAGLRSSSSAPGPDLAPSSRLHALPPLDTPISYEVVSYTSTPVESSLSGALGDNTVYFTTPSIIRVSIPIATYTPPLHRLYPPRDLRTPSALSPLATTVAPPAWYHSPRLTIEHLVYHTPPFHRIHPSYYWPSLSQDSSYAHPLPPPLHIHDLYSNDPTTVSHAYYPPSFSLSPYFERQHTPAASRPQPLPIARTSSTGPSLQLIDIATQLPASSFPAIRFHSTSSGLSQPSYAVPATPVRHAPVDEALTVPPLTSTELNPTTAAWPVRRQQRSARNAWTCTFCSSQFPDEDSLDQHRQMHARQQGTLNMTGILWHIALRAPRVLMSSLQRRARSPRLQRLSARSVANGRTMMRARLVARGSVGGGRTPYVSS
jgi:hypothetical protein